MSFAFGRPRAVGQRQPLLTHVKKPPEASFIRKKHTESYTSGITKDQDSKRLTNEKKAPTAGWEDSRRTCDTSTAPRSRESNCQTITTMSGDIEVHDEPRVDMSFGRDSGYSSYRESESGRSAIEILHCRKKSSTKSRRDRYRIAQVNTKSTTLGDSDRRDRSGVHDADNSVITDQFGSLYLSSDKDSSITSSGASKQAEITTNHLNKNLKTVEPGRLAKRLIYKKYLQAYIPSMFSIPNKRITILDLFSGTGRASEHNWPAEIENYETAIIALRVALHHLKRKGKEDAHFDNDRQFCVDAYLDGIEHLKKNANAKIEMNSSDKHKVVLIFVEGNRDLYKELIKTVITVIKMYRLRLDEERKFQEGICKVICDFRGTDRTNKEYLIACYIVHADISQVDPPSGNCLTVFDLHGDTSIPLETVKKLIGPQKQLFISLNSNIGSLNSGDNGLVASSMSRESLGSRLTANELNSFEQTLKQMSRENLMLSMDMQDRAQELQFHFLFLASHFKSFTCMKEKMNDVGQHMASILVSTFRNFGGLSDEFTSTEMAAAPSDEFTSTEMAVADTIYSRFRGTEVVMSEVKTYIWFETPYVFRKTPLKILEKHGKLRVKTEDHKRRWGTFPDRTDWNFVFRT